MARRVALISSSYYPRFGGVEEHVRHLARHLVAAGNEVVVWTVDRGERLGTRQVDGITVHYLPTPLPARDAGALARFAKQTPAAWHAWSRAHRDFRPDLLHVHCFGPNGVYALALHHRFGAPLVVSSHGETFMDDHAVFDESALLRSALRRALGSAAAVTACSSATAEDVRDRFGAGPITIVPNAVDVAESADDARPAWWPRRGRVILGLGRLVPIKGFDLLIRAFVTTHLADEHLVIAGDGSEREALRRLAEELGVADRVHLPGRLDRPDVAAAMAAADVVVVPSRMEAFGIVALEAWRAGKPLVMSSRGGAEDFVVDGVNGLLVDPLDTTALATAIRSVLDDPDLSQRLATTGASAVLDYTWDRVARDYEQVYDAVLGEPSTQRPKVVVLDHTAELGGAELALVRLLDAIGPEADVTTVLLSDGPLVTELRAHGHPVEVLGAPAAATRVRRSDLARMPLGLLRLGPTARHVAGVVRRADADLIHTTSLKADLLGLVVGRLTRRPVVWHVHDRIADDYLPRPVVALVRRAARHAAAVVANSAATAATLPGRSDVVVAPPGMSPKQIREAPRPRPAEPPLVGLVGRISPTKDQLTFVRAAATVHRSHPSVRFVIAGAAAFGFADYERRVRSEVERLDLREVVRFAGFVDDVPTLLDQLTLCVHTSSIPEPFGQAVVEAMARGVPVIATAGGGVDEIFAQEPGQDLGWLIEARSPDTLAAAIQAALDDPDEAERRGHAAWQSVRAHYPIAVTAHRVLATWHRVQTTHRPRRRRVVSAYDNGRDT